LKKGEIFGSPEKIIDHLIFEYLRKIK